MGALDERAFSRCRTGTGRVAVRLHNCGRPSLSVPGWTGHAVDIEVAAARNLGMRLTVTRGSMNLSEKDGGHPPLWCSTLTPFWPTANE